MLDSQYIVRNVPITVSDDGEKCLDFDVSFKLTTLRDLMYEGKIGKQVNYNDYDGIVF